MHYGLLNCVVCSIIRAIQVIFLLSESYIKSIIDAMIACMLYRNFYGGERIENINKLHSSNLIHPRTIQKVNKGHTSKPMPKHSFCPFVYMCVYVCIYIIAQRREIKLILYKHKHIHSIKLLTTMPKLSTKLI